MATPPPAYDAIASVDWRVAQEKATKGEQRWNIREVVASSRTQHVASIVEQLLPQIKTRAQQGYSRTELILIPSDEQNARGGQLIGIEPEHPPLIVQFEGGQNSTAFWSQDVVVTEMQRQLLATLGIEKNAELPLPVQLTKPGRSNGWFSRRGPKEPEVQPVTVKHQPVSLQVRWDDLYSRSETEYGLLETKRAQAVFIEIDVR